MFKLFYLLVFDTCNLQPTKRNACMKSLSRQMVTRDFISHVYDYILFHSGTSSIPNAQCVYTCLRVTLESSSERGSYILARSVSKTIQHLSGTGVYITCCNTILSHACNSGADAILDGDSARSILHLASMISHKVQRIFCHTLDEETHTTYVIT